jgi:hypothetical protein
MISFPTFLPILPEIGRTKLLFLDEMAANPSRLPHFVRRCPVAMRYLALLGPLAWRAFPERGLKARGEHAATLPYASFAAAQLSMLEEGFTTTSQLWRYLSEHPGLSWLLGFDVRAGGFISRGARFQVRLPRQRHFNRVLRQMPNAALQTLLDSSVHLLQTELAKITPDFGQAISLDTRVIIAWVKENNPKAYVKTRYNPNQQPQGDPDCRLGVKRRRNVAPGSQTARPTPRGNPVAGSQVFSQAEYYWGYASGVVATKVPGWAEVVLAEMTQPFDHADVAYFFPLMRDVERRLGFRPAHGAFDAAFDAFYVYEQFYRPDQAGFAAVPLAQRGGYTERFFDPEGLPLCPAGRAMPLKFTFIDRTRAIIEHERGKYVCPLRYPQVTGETCPIHHHRWAHGGCTADMPTSVGARIRYQLDRKSADYKAVYKQRTATERINSQAEALGIERPHLRSRQAIANRNTLIYVLINLRALQRIRRQKAARA